jgi:hypothetical protein
MKIVGKAVLSTALLLFIVPAAQSAGDAGADRLISARIDARPGRTTEMYRVPGGMELVVTQACVTHAAVHVKLGRDGHALNFGGIGCTEFGPGMVVSGGEVLYCTNRSGVRRNCMMIGMLRDDPARGEGAEFIDVDEVLAAVKRSSSPTVSTDRSVVLGR